MALSGALVLPPASALVPCGSSLKDSLPAAGPSNPGQFSPERGPCDDSVPLLLTLTVPPGVLDAIHFDPALPS